jgi:hypothetical protein
MKITRSMDLKPNEDELNLGIGGGQRTLSKTRKRNETKTRERDEN